MGPPRLSHPLNGVATFRNFARSNGFLHYIQKQNKIEKLRKQLRAVDHSARGSMKNVAKYDSLFELQYSQRIEISNAHCGYGA